MFENKVIEMCCVILLAVSIAYIGIQTIHGIGEVKNRTELCEKGEMK